MLNEELQKFVLLLVGVVRRVVVRLDEQRGVVAMLRRVGKKHFRKVSIRYYEKNRVTNRVMRCLSAAFKQLNFDLTRLDPDPIAHHFVSAVRDIIVSSRAWNEEVEASYILLIK